MKHGLFAFIVLISCVPLPAEENMVTFKDLPYVKDGGPRQRLDIHLPKDYQAKEPLPLIVWVHGGGWVGGDKNDDLSRLPVQFGFACASINYRYATQSPFPAQLEDCKAAIRWLRAHAQKYNLNPDKIGVWGASAGGHLVALLGTTGETKEFDVGDHLDQSGAVQAVCDIFGPADLILIADQPEKYVAGMGAVVQLLGGPLKEKWELAKAASPSHHVQKGKKYPPFLILHGEQDKLVDVEQSVRFEKVLKDAGVEVELIVDKEAGHDGRVMEGPGVGLKILTFFIKALKTP